MAAYLLRIPPAPAVQTLARIGQASAKGISADAAGNVYLAVSAGVTDLILLHSSKDNTIVQLPISRDSYLDMEGLAVSPDGEELYIADQEGIDIYQAPWTGQPQRFAIGFRDCMGIQCYKRGCLLLMDGDAVDHLHLESRQRTGLFGAFDICNNPCFSISPPSSTGAAGVPAPATLSLVYSDALRLNPRDPEELETCIRVASIDANNPQPLGEEAPAIRLSWPVGFEPPKGLSLVLRGANGDGAVLFHVRGSPQRLFQVSPSDGQVQLLAGPAPGAEHANWATNRDYWQGCSLGQVRLPYLECSTLDADGNLVGFDEEAGMLIRIRLGLKPPVHLQPPPAPPPPPPTWDIELASPGQLGSDWGALLASGEGADVELRCAGGAVHKAHSLVLSARCEWFRRRQSSGLGNTAVVDLPEHTAATMACVLQFLYTGHVSLAPSAAPIAQDSTAAAAASSTGAVAAAAAAASDTSDVWQLLRSVSYFQGLSAHDPVLLVPLLMVAADQLQLPDLHEACLQLAQIQLSPRTALPWLLAAHMGKLEALQKAAFEYVAANYAESVEQSPVPAEAVAQHAPMVAAALMRAVAAGDTSDAKRTRLA